MTLSADDTHRLSLIRLLLNRAEEESRAGGPFSADAINRLHDVAEMYLALAVQVHHRKIPRDFLGYWDELEPLLGRPLAYRAQMQKFNKVRVNLKHYGVEPADREIEAARAAVVGLLHDESPDLFGIEFDDVNLSGFVRSDEGRQLLNSAEERWQQGDPSEALADISDAFGVVISDYTERKLIGHRRSVFKNASDMTFLSPFFRKVDRGKQRDFDEAVIKSLESLDYAVTLVGLGVDMRRYGRFRATVPIVVRMANGRRRVHRRHDDEVSDEDFEFCRDFVIATAIHLAAFDYDFNLWEAGRSKLRSMATSKTASPDESQEHVPD